MKRIFWVELLGWIGVAALFSGYALLTFSVIQTGLLYQLLNLIGAFGLGITALHTKNYQSLVVQVLWGVVAMSGLWLVGG